jgi:surface protein
MADPVVLGDDLLLVNRDGVDYHATRDEVRPPVCELEELPGSSMPWEGHNGGIWHIKDVTGDGLRMTWKGPFTAWDIDGENEREVDWVHAGEELVFVTGPRQFGIFGGDGNWNFGEITDTSKVKSFEKLFYSCENFNGTLGGNWDTSQVTNFFETFYKCRKFNQPLSGWDTSRATDMHEMFNGCWEFNQDVSGFDVSRAKTLRAMFYECKKFNQPLASWTLSNSPDLDIGEMFRHAKEFDQDISGWDISNVESLLKMFWDAWEFNQPLNAWDVSNVWQMEGMFRGTKKFNQPLDSWDMSTTTGCENMFEESAFNQDISGWDMSLAAKVNTWGASPLKYMFKNNKAFNQDLSQWCVSKNPDPPKDFDKGADAWTEPRPVWGTCPRGEDAP